MVIIKPLVSGQTHLDMKKSHRMPVLVTPESIRAYRKEKYRLLCLSNSATSTQI